MPRGDEIVRANGVDLCFEAFGNRGDPALLLIMGSSASMDWWDSELCQRLADGSRYVIRYDHRDTGRSVSYEPGAPGYTGDDLAADAAALPEALGVGTAHLVGMSMGGGIAQVVALDHPDRVASLTLISTSPAASEPGASKLPGMSDEARARFAALSEPDWSDREAVIDYVVELERACAGSLPFDEERFRAYAESLLQRTTNIRSALTNHDLIAGGGAPPKRQLGELTTPTLIVHGTEDPVLPYPHGLALAEAIPGAKLLTLEGVGHELPRAAWDRVVPEILEHTAADPPTLAP